MIFGVHKKSKRSPKNSDRFRPVSFTDEMDEKVTAFCHKYIVLTELLYRDNELRKWCKNHSSHKKTESHISLEKTIYDMATEVSNIGFYGEVLSSKPYSEYSFAEALDGTKYDLMYGIFLEIRMDYSDGNYLIPESLARGRLYRLMKAYLEYESKNESERGFRMEYLTLEETGEAVKKPDTVYLLSHGGVLIKIDRKKKTAYRFDLNKKEWIEIKSLYYDYAYGEPLGKEVWIDDVYKTVEP